MRFRPLVTSCVHAAAALCGLASLMLFSPARTEADTWYTINNPIDPSQLTDMPWGYRSFWLQPWRSSLVTQPATLLQNAIGINFDVKGTEAPATAELLKESGFRRARMEIGWNQEGGAKCVARRRERSQGRAGTYRAEHEPDRR
jgi:hypothetical protein